MGLIATLARFAYAEPRVFPVLGEAGRELWPALRAPRVAPPHDADILLLLGGIPGEWDESLRALFETLARPRAAVWLQPPGSTRQPRLPLADRVPPGEPLTPARLAAALEPARRHDAALLQDAPPTPWRGRGDHGQGGEGMMGGTPYGRPMAMTAEDPDQLALDDVPTAVGPFFPHLPPGLRLTLQLQGDRVRAVSELASAFPEAPLAVDAPWRWGLGNGPALRVLAGEAVPVAELEAARADSHLAWMADFLALLGLAELAAGAHRLRSAPDAEELRRLARGAERAGLARLCAGVAPLPAARVRQLGLTGPLAAASGVDDDPREADAAYRELGYRPVLAEAGDNYARWRVHLEQCLQALEIGARAGQRSSRAPAAPRGPLRRTQQGLRLPTAVNLPVLENLLPGLLWEDALSFIASADLDLAEARVR